MKAGTMGASLVAVRPRADLRGPRAMLASVLGTRMPAAWRGRRLVDARGEHDGCRGILTMARPVLEEVVALGDADELLALAAAVEASSEHPLGCATLDAALDRGLRVPPVEEFEAAAGRGVTARVGGRRVLVGRAVYLEENGVDVSPLRRRIAELEAAGQTVVVVGRDRELLGGLSFGDELREDAVAAVAAMKGAGMVPVLVTGATRAPRGVWPRRSASKTSTLASCPVRRRRLCGDCRSRAASPWWATGSTTRRR